MTGPAPSQDFANSDTYAAELARINARRSALSDDGPLPPGRRPWGIALSGGGIRSATFALGVLQSLAKKRAPAGGATPAANPLLSRFDYLSTVSGGGYVGGFFSALFRPPQSRGAGGTTVKDALVAKALSDQAYERLAIDPPGRLTNDTTADEPDLPLRWLRENGRYMAPAGVGDLFYAACLQLRNWCAIQYVIGIMLLAIALAGLSFRAASQMLVDADFLYGFVRHAESSMQPASSGDIWWSPWFWAALLLTLLVTVPIGVAYWFSYRARGDESRLRRILTSPVTAALVFLICVTGLAFRAYISDVVSPVTYGITWIAIALALAVVAFAASGGNRGTLAQQRVRLTRWLAASLKVALGCALLGLIETVGQTLYLLMTLHFASKPSAPTLSAIAAAIAAALPMTKKLAALLTNNQAGGAPPRSNRGALLPIVAAVLLFLLATCWYILALTLFFGGNAPLSMAPAGADAPIITAPLADAAGKAYFVALLGTTAIALCASGYFVGFLNLSSLATLYSARLTRAYLGASNLKRFTSNGRKNSRDVAEPHPQDDFKPTPYYDSTHYGPLHLINVTINSTTGPGDNLTQMDRKGLPMAITPTGISVNGAEALPFTEVDTTRKAAASAFASAAGITGTATAKPAGIARGGANAARAAGEPLTIGQWIGVSGAAFSPGIGRGTTPALATLCTLANVRLGYWWNSMGQRSGMINKLSALIANQRYLLREMSGRFYGASRQFWYLTDGGHFENTAVYELLRRRCELVLTCDDGADGNYAFEDLANLMRLARIDFGADFTPLTQAEATIEFTKVGLVFGREVAKYMAEQPGQLKKAREGGAHCAIAYRINYRDFPAEPTLLVVIKPRLTADAPLDLLQYQSTHTDFPQESTLDQFFDEAQWESYRKLGAISAERIFGAG